MTQATIEQDLPLITETASPALPIATIEVSPDAFDGKQLRRILAIQLVAALTGGRPLPVDEFQQYAQAVDAFIEAGRVRI